MPELLNRGHLREEPMPAKIEAPAVPLDGTADPAHLVCRLEHRHGASGVA